MGQKFGNYLDFEKRIDIKRPEDFANIFNSSLKFYFTHKDQSRIECQISGHHEYEYQAPRDKIISIVTTITDRPMDRPQLDISRERFRSVTHSSLNAVIMLDYSLNIVVCNPIALALFGYTTEEVLGRSLDILISESLHSAPKNPTLRFPVRQHLELIGKRRDGSEFPLRISLNDWLTEHNEQVFYAIMRDLTAEKLMQERMLNAEKLNTVGQLAAGIVHEIRNPLTTVSGLLQYLATQYPEEEKTVTLAMEELQRVESILQEMLSTCKPHKTCFEVIDLETVINSLRILLTPQACRNHVTLIFDYDPVTLPRIFGDKNQLRQLAVNLIKNGIEAMPDGGVMTTQIIRDNDHVALRFIDQGDGIADESKDAIGQPFFTTKRHGTGLGLMVCQQIVRDHRGELSIKNATPRGTQVTVLLPLPLSFPSFMCEQT